MPATNYVLAFSEHCIPPLLVEPGADGTSPYNVACFAALATTPAFLRLEPFVSVDCGLPCVWLRRAQLCLDPLYRAAAGSHRPRGLQNADAGRRALPDGSLQLRADLRSSQLHTTGFSPGEARVDAAAGQLEAAP